MKKLFKKRAWILALGFLLVMAVSPVSYAGGIRVSPVAFCLQNADIGKELDLGVDLIITNNTSEEQVFMIRSLKPSQAKRKWLKGYSEIPDASWFYFPEDKIKIEPNGEGKLRMHLKIPDEEKYLNQHWMVYVEVTPEAKKGQMFKIGIKPNYMIETKVNADVKERSYGILGLAPSTSKAQNIIPGRRKKASFKIYNNDNIAHTYTISSYIPKSSSAKQDIRGTPGYEWVKNANWVKPAKRKIKLNAGGTKTVRLNVLVPKYARCGDEGWESIVMIEPDEGLSGFVRVLIEPKK
ncbi:MAG: hypothetical protein AB1567_01010 [bacterium]